MVRLTVSAPASSANVGPGFDSFGLALNNPRDIVEVDAVSGDGRVEVELSGLTEYSVPTRPETNSGGVVAKAILERFGLNNNISIKITKRIRPGCGLGSSGATAAGVAFALNKLLGLGLSVEELIGLAAEGERAAAASPHPDNVAASLLGGFTMIVSRNPIRVYRIRPPPTLQVCVVYPHFEAERKTEKMRSVIPSTVGLHDALWNVWHAAAVAAGFALGDIELLGLGMDDAIVERARSKLIPCYEEVKKKALLAGAKGVAVSGAGPAMIAFVKMGDVDPYAVLRDMLGAYSDQGVAAEGFVTVPGEGCLIESQQ
ncbi:MAG: homoserine kinase [Thermoprotei archaeon]